MTESAVPLAVCAKCKTEWDTWYLRFGYKCPTCGTVLPDEEIAEFEQLHQEAFMSMCRDPGRGTFMLQKLDVGRLLLTWLTFTLLMAVTTVAFLTSGEVTVGGISGSVVSGLVIAFITRGYREVTVTVG